MKNYPPAQKPAELAESRLIGAILDGTYPFETFLPPERELSERLGVTRPTLRETLQRLGRDGWIEIHQGKPTRVRNPWQEGNLAVLSHLAEHPNHSYPQFVEHLLTVRCLLAPAYSRAAVEKAPEKAASLLRDHPALDATADAFAEFDWKLHLQLSILSGNPVFTMILNGFAGMYLELARHYFFLPDARDNSINFYRVLLQAAQAGNCQLAEEICQRVMQESITFWHRVQFQEPGG